MVLIQYCKSVICEDFDFGFFWGHRLFWVQKLVRSKNGYKLIESYLDDQNFIRKKFSPEINHYSKNVIFYRANKYESPCNRTKLQKHYTSNKYLRILTYIMNNNMKLSKKDSFQKVYMPQCLTRFTCLCASRDWC